jgi:hypothetical protein
LPFDAIVETRVKEGSCLFHDSSGAAASSPALDRLREPGQCDILTQGACHQCGFQGKRSF